MDEINHFLERIHLPRQVKARAWLVLNEYTVKELAAKLNVDPAAISKAINGTAPYDYIIEGLQAEGMPSSILPEPRPFMKPGPKPRMLGTEAVHAG